MTYTMTEFAVKAHNKDEGIAPSWQPDQSSNVNAVLDAESIFQDMVDFESANDSVAATAGEMGDVDGLGELPFPESLMAGLDGLPIISSATDLLEFHQMLSQASTTGDMTIEEGLKFGFELVTEDSEQLGQQSQLPSQPQQEHLMRGSPEPTVSTTHAPDAFRGQAISDTELLKLEGISLQSPRRPLHGFTPSPSPPCSALRPPRLLDAVSSTMIRASNNTCSRTMQGFEARNRSPTQPRQQQLQGPVTLPRPTFPSGPSLSSAPMPSPPIITANGGPSFVSGFVEDPFADQSTTAPTQVPRVRASHDNIGVAQSQRVARARKASIQRSVSMVGPGKPCWPTAGPEGTISWSQQDFATLASELDGLPDSTWWDADPLPVLASSPTRNASLNLARHMSQSDMAFEINSPTNASSSSSSSNNMMLHMPQPRQLQPGILNDLALSAATYLPPPAHQSPQHSPRNPHHQHDRSRPPRAPSSSTRHMSAPMRRARTRSESASPSPARGRGPSGGESGHRRTPSGASPGSSSSIRKRRSSRMREPRTQSAGNIGFVNFTPDDCQVLMTGVAPSGSSKTKAKREREAIERRRKLSEAALKAVEAAGGDVEKLAAEGFMAY
jgi:hypothetical protein